MFKVSTYKLRPTHNVYWVLLYSKFLGVSNFSFIFILRLTPSWRRLLSYRNRSIDLLCTGFYMTTASVMKELKGIAFLHHNSKVNYLFGIYIVLGKINALLQTYDQFNIQYLELLYFHCIAWMELVVFQNTIEKVQ